MKKFRKLITLLTVLALLGACAAVSFAEEKTFKVALTPTDMKATYASWLAQSFEEIAKEYPNIQLDIIDGQNDVAHQMSVIEDCVTNGYDMIILHPVDPDAQATLVTSTIEAGTPMLIVNQGTGGVEIVSNVDADPVEQGMIPALVAKDKIPEGGKVVVLLGPSGNVHSAGRLVGFEEYLFKARPDIEVLDTQIANWYKDQAMSYMEDWLQRFDQIDAVISMNDAMALGAIEAARAAGRLEDMTYYGVDGLADACLSIEAGELTATCVQNAYAQAAKSMEIADKVLTGEIELERTLVPGELIDPSNVADWIQIHTANGQIQG